MAKQFDRILDESANRILIENATVEECLAHYPEYAAELEPHLRVVARAARAYAFTPSPAAKERGRQRLQQVLREQQKRDREAGAHKNPWQWLTFALPPRWAVAIAAVVIVVVVGGSGTVAASGDALPGETLYPVKRATEEVRLALQPSQMGKAKLHLAHAERRAEEVDTLVRIGDTQLLEASFSALRENLVAVARVTDQVQEQPAIDQLKSQLNASASQVLASLQAALQVAPEATRQTATEIFQGSSDAYANAVEAVASHSPDLRVALAPGVLQVWAVDPPPPDVEKLLVEVGRVEAHLVAGSDSQWVTITLEPQTFDLLRIAAVQRFLGEQKVRPGTYTRVRFQINAATAVAGGRQYPVKIPSEALSLTRPFRVAEGQTTVVLLDFDGTRSLHRTGQGEYILIPNVSVFAREPVDQEQEPRKEHRQERKKKREKADRAEAPAAETEAVAVNVELNGTIEESVPDSLVVRGKRIAVSPDSQTKQELRAGRSVEIEAVVRPDGSFVAMKVEPESREQRAEDDGKVGGSTVRVSGVIESIGPTEWTVKGHKVRVTAGVKIRGRAVVGALVEVEGTRLPDGTIVAEVIEAMPKESPPEPAGVQVEIKQEREGQDEKSSQPGDAPKQLPVRISGNIEFISLAHWRVKGQEVIIGKETAIEGTPAVGFHAQIEGVRGPDGRVLARSIKVQGSRPESLPKEDKETEQPSTRTPSGIDGERPERLRITGTIVEVGLDSWRVNDQTVVLTDQTRIEGTPRLGARVEVEGVRLAEGKILAVKVRVQPTRSEGQKHK